jgi:hypothetical protein
VVGSGNHEAKEASMKNLGTISVRARRLAGLAGVLAAAAAMLAVASPAAKGCPVCGKNLIKNPGADAGMGVMAVDAYGAVPGWTNAAGQFGAASYAFPNGWFGTTSKGPKVRGKNYFFGGATRLAIDSPASIGTQVIVLPRAAAGRKATLSGWLGNYSDTYAQVRADFMDAQGKALARVKIGPSTLVSGSDMFFRSRSGKVPAGATQVTISVIFSGGSRGLYKLAGADSLSLVLT